MCRGGRFEREAGQRQAVFFADTQHTGLQRLGDRGHGVLFLLVGDGVGEDERRTTCR
jgi:hypothetical protein